MKTVRKYPIGIGPATLPLGPKAMTIHVGEQEGSFYLWALLDTDEDTGDGRDFVVFPTGDEVTSQEHWVGTFQCMDSNGAPFVGHVFELLQ